MQNSSLNTARERLIVALDVPTLEEAQTIVKSLEGAANFFKIGYQLAFAGGLGFARELKQSGYKIFLDMKLLDIDNTITKGVENIAKLGVDMMTLHAYPKAMRAAVEAAKGSNLCLLGVTVLTSMDDNDLVEAGYNYKAADLVIKRAQDAAHAGMGGVVASAQEAARIREIFSADKNAANMAIVTPGIRPKGAATGDQKRVMTPALAIKAGASHLVVGRPIIAADDKKETASHILKEIAENL